MFNDFPQSDDVEVYELSSGTYGGSVSLNDNCKSNIIVNAATSGTATFSFNLPINTYSGRVINFTVFNGTNGTGKASSTTSTVYIQHSNTTLFTLKQGTVSFMYVGQQLNGLTATDKSKSGWIILGGVQGDTAITGYAGSVAIGNGAYCGNINSIAVGSGAYNTGDQSVAVGNTCYTNSNSAVAIGNGANATQQSAVALLGSASGVSAIAIRGQASGQNSITIGENSFCGHTYGVAIGRNCYTKSSKLSFKANNYFNVAKTGDAQAGKFILMGVTISGPVILTSDGGGTTSASNILILPNTSTYAFKGIVVARNGFTGDSAMWEVSALMKRGANASTTALVGTPTITKVFGDAGTSTFTITLTADTTNGGGVITMTGNGTDLVYFVTNIDSAEVIG